MTIGTQKLPRMKKKVIPTENIKAEVEVVAAAEADVEIVVDIEAEEVRTLFINISVSFWLGLILV